MNLKSDTLLYASAVLTERVLGLLLLPILTRWLSADEYGVWAQTAVVSSVLMPLVLLGMPAAIVRYFAGGVGTQTRRRWMQRLLLGALLLFGLLALLGTALPGPVAEAVYGNAAQRPFVQVLALVLAADALFDLLIAFLRAGFRMRRIALLLLLRGGLRAAWMVLALRQLALPFQTAFMLLAAAQLAVVVLAYAAELWRDDAAPAVTAAANTTAPTLHAMLAFAAPLLLVAVLGSVNAFADRFILAHVAGLAAVARYAAVATLVSITGVVTSVLGFTLFPALSRLWAQGDRAQVAALAADAVRVFLFVAVPFTAWLALAAPTLLPLIATQAYRVDSSVVLLLGGAAIAFGLYQTLLYVLLLAGKGLQAAALMAVAGALNCAGNLLLVPALGLLGAALAALLSNALLAVGAGLAAVRWGRFAFPWRSAARIGLAAAAGAVLLALIAQGGEWPALLLGSALALALYLAADLAPGGSVLRGVVLRGVDWRRALA